MSIRAATLALVLVVPVATSCSCSKQPSPQPQVLAYLPVRMVVEQRTTTAVPGSAGAIRLTIDDVTAGQVIASISGIDGDVLLAPVSLKPEGRVRFDAGQEPFWLTLEKLENALIGNDFATVLISSAAPNALWESAKIERLIASIGSLDGAVFLRNGDEHDAKEAADHLRTKWKAADDEAMTAEQFIDAIASKSSISGEPYRIRLGDGWVVLAGEYLRERLAEIESGEIESPQRFEAEPSGT